MVAFATMARNWKIRDRGGGGGLGEEMAAGCGGGVGGGRGPTGIPGLIIRPGEGLDGSGQKGPRNG